MLPLVSSAIPRLTGTRSALKCVTSTGWSSSYTTKSSCFSPDTKRPAESATVAVTLIRSTPLLKRNCDGGGSCCACNTAPTAHTTNARRKASARMTFVHVRHDGRVASETDAIAHDAFGVRHHDGERRIAPAGEPRGIKRGA